MLRPLKYNPPPHQRLDILHQDKGLVIVNKPSGLLSVAGRGEDKQDCMHTRLQAEYPSALVVHRLDMSTSGILLFALDKAMQRALSILFEKRRVEKQYTARVYGQVGQPRGIIDAPLITDWPNRPRQKIDLLQGKPSVTEYTRISVDTAMNSTRLQLHPMTGRSHQLRVHLLSLGHPILGDELYGNEASRNASDRLLLHAERLAFRHPTTGQPLDIHCPADFE